MKITKGKYLVIFLSLLFLLTVSAVSAEENSTEILADGDEPGSFDDLQSEIDGSEGYISLDKDYTYDDSTDEAYKTNGVNINKKITIEGNNHTIDARNSARIFTITASEVILNNINFINANNNAIFVLDTVANITINNSRFINNYVIDSNGGAVHILSNDSVINNSYFSNNRALWNQKNQDDYVLGGAVCWEGTNGVINNSVFDKNFVNSIDFEGSYIHIHSGSGGAVYWNGDYGLISNSNFTRNSASRHAGAIYLNHQYGIIRNSIFINNTAAIEAGAVKCHRSNTLVENSKFINNTAEDDDSIGGAMYWSRNTENTSLRNSYFEGNNASTGSAIYKEANAILNIYNSIFINNQANSSKLEVTRDGLKFTATLYGKDNIINAIWNNENEKSVIIDGVKPVLAVEDSNNGQLLYQDDREFNQTITVTIYDENNRKLYSKNLTTNYYGQVEFTAYNGKKIEFKHNGDVLYTEISDSADISLSLESSDKTSYPNEYVAIPVNLENYKIGNGTITVKVGDETVTCPANASEVIIKSPPKRGEYPISVTYTDPYGINLTSNYTLKVLSRSIEVNITVDDVIYPNIAHAIVSANVTGKYIITVPGTTINKEIFIGTANADLDFVLGDLLSARLKDNSIYRADEDLDQVLDIGEYTAIITSAIEGYETATNQDDFKVIGNETNSTSDNSTNKTDEDNNSNSTPEDVNTTDVISNENATDLTVDETVNDVKNISNVVSDKQTGNPIFLLIALILNLFVVRRIEK